MGSPVMADSSISAEPLTIVASVPDGPGWRLRFAEIPDRTAAESLRDAYLEAVVEPGQELGTGEYYWHEVIGATVRDLEGAELGTVVDVYRTGETETLAVRGERYGEFDVPIVRPFVRIFAPRRREIVVDAAALDLRPVKVRPVRPPRPVRAPRPPRRSRVPAGGGVPGAAGPAAATGTGAAPRGRVGRPRQAPPGPDHGGPEGGR